MKKLFLLILVSLFLFSCKKENKKQLFHEKLIGSWKMECGKLNPSSDWICGLNIEPTVNVSENYISSPWDRSYSVVDENTFQWIVGTNSTSTVDVVFYSDTMVWCFSDNSIMKFSSN